MKRIFFLVSAIVILLQCILIYLWYPFAWGLLVVVPLFAVGLFDVVQRRHTILRNFPVIGHFRFMLEAIRPEIFQYFVESDWEGRPLTRMQRSVIYQRSKGVLDTLPFGTRKNIYEPYHEWLNHSLKALSLGGRDYNPILVGASQCAQPYEASILNASAMSFGALSPEAVMAINRGAKAGGFYQNTGEGGLSPYHLKYGGDVVWQIGTGYFGCRTPEGTFSPEHFKERATHANVKMIEVKLSQGAKPGHGGVLPGVKVSQEIADIRLVPMGQDVISPPSHSAFSNPIEMMEFLAHLRELSGGKPVGIKLCLGEPIEFMALCKAMLKTGLRPDFVTVDGAEGGTGAAPLEFSNAVGSPLLDALPFVYNTLVGTDLKKHIRVIASGKLTTAFEILSKLAMGADMCNQARAMMLAVGCIQSLKCNTNRCPTGVTTQDPGLRYGLSVENKYKRVTNYHNKTVKDMMELVGAAGLHCHTELKPHHIYRRLGTAEVKRLDEIYEYLEPGQLLGQSVPQSYAEAWASAQAETF